MADGTRINTLEQYDTHFTADPDHPFHFVEKLAQRIESDSKMVGKGEWEDQDRWNNLWGNSLAGTLYLISKGRAGIELLTTIVSTIEDEFIKQGLEGFGGISGLMERDSYARDSIKEAFSKSGQVFTLSNEK